MKRMNIIKTTGLVLASTLLVACSPNEEPADNEEQVVDVETTQVDESTADEVNDDVDGTEDGTASGIGNQGESQAANDEKSQSIEEMVEAVEGELDASQTDYFFQEIPWSDNNIQILGFESVDDLDQYVIDSSILLLEDLQADSPDDLSRAVIEDYKDFVTLYVEAVADDFDYYTDLDDSEKAGMFTGHLADNHLFSIIYMTSLEMAVKVNDNQEYSDFQKLMLELNNISDETATALTDIADKHGIEYN